MNFISAASLNREALLDAISASRDLWNREVSFIWPIASDIMDQNITDHVAFVKEASFLAYNDEDELIGFLFSKDMQGKHNNLVPKWDEEAWITLFYVARAYRKNGIGTKLIESAVSYFKEKGKKKVTIGRDIENFFPGVPCDFDNLTDKFLKNRGFEIHGYTHDLIGNRQSYPMHEDEFEYRVATNDDIEAIRDFFKDTFPGRWQYEFEEYLEEPIRGNDYLIATKGKKVVGFFRVNDGVSSIRPYNVTWYPRFKKLGGVGPLGVRVDYRKNGIGSNLLAYGLKVLYERGCTDIILDWTGLLAKYQKVGFQVWKMYQYFDITFDKEK